MSEKVSCIITTYHRLPFFVERAIKSIQNQTYQDLEIIVVDDNQDGNDYSIKLQEALAAYEDVIYIKQQGNRGACAARNLGIQRASGKYVAFLDDDDEWLPEKIAVQKVVFDQAASARLGLVFCDGYIVFDNDPGKKELYNPGNENRTPSHQDLLYADYIGSTSQPLILKDAIVDVGMFDETFPARQDYEMWIRISGKYNVQGIDQPLFLYHQHEGEQITSSGRRALMGYVKIYKKYRKEYFRNGRAYCSIMDRILTTARDCDKKMWYAYRLLYKCYRVFHWNKIG
jgi:glycosyltransferase involved in cell wall biosynthesis